MIRNVGDRRAISSKTICNRRRRVIQILRLDQNVTDSEETFFKLCVMQAACELMKFYREVRVLHLAGKGILEAALKRGGTVYVQLSAGEECRSKEGKSLNVIP